VAAASIAYAGCAGDCMTCHPSLKGDKDHLALVTCIQCHTPSAEQKLFEFGGGSAEECGNDCFQCHNNWPQNGNHAPLDTCQDCHKK